MPRPPTPPNTPYNVDLDLVPSAVIGKAWTDSRFLSDLIRDPATACASMGFPIATSTDPKDVRAYAALQRMAAKLSAIDATKVALKDPANSIGTT